MSPHIVSAFKEWCYSATSISNMLQDIADGSVQPLHWYQNEYSLQASVPDIQFPWHCFKINSLSLSHPNRQICRRIESNVNFQHNPVIAATCTVKPAFHEESSFGQRRVKKLEVLFERTLQKQKFQIYIQQLNPQLHITRPLETQIFINSSWSSEKVLPQPLKHRTNDQETSDL